MEKVEFLDWKKLDLRVGQIKQIGRVENADKLYKLEIDLGKEKQIVVSGLIPYYSEKELLNKKIILFCNLAPKKIKGIESRGMVLAVVDEKQNKVKLLQPDEDIENGSRVC